MVRLLVALLAFALAAPAAAQPSDAALRAQGGQVVRLLRGEAAAEELFSLSFLAAVPAAQVRAIAGQLQAQYGATRGLAGVAPRSATAGTIRIDFERAVVAMDIQIDPAPPHRINGLLVTNVEVRDDSLERVLAELRALPGQTGLSIVRLGNGAPNVIAAHNQDGPLAVGSAFKLVILAELTRQVRAGRRRWSDVVTLDRRSIPSGTLQNWPAGAPVTLHTLASLMISVSDNTAADILLHALGRENVERMMATTGLIDGAARNRPFLSTLEMAVIKTSGEAGLAAWRAADEAGRRRLLATAYAQRDASGIDVAAFTGNPLALDVEWFASPHDLVRVMDWFRREGEETARAILAINPAMSAAQRQGLSYVGYKGGSEPGVLNLTWLVRGRDGVWYAVAGTWNDPAAPVDESRLLGLMARAIRLATSSSTP